MRAGIYKKTYDFMSFFCVFIRPFAFKTKWINEEIIVLIWAVFHMSEKKGISVETMVILIIFLLFSIIFLLFFWCFPLEWGRLAENSTALSGPHLQTMYVQVLQSPALQPHQERKQMDSGGGPETIGDRKVLFYCNFHFIDVFVFFFVFFVFLLLSHKNIKNFW